MILVAVLLILAIVTATATENWRVSVIGLGLHYVATSVLLVQTLGTPVGLGRLMVGATVTGIVWLALADIALPRRVKRPKGTTAEQLDAQQGQDRPTSPFFRIITLGLCTVGAFGLADNYPLVGAGGEAMLLNATWYLLVIAGAFSAAITREPLGQGIGLLFLLSGADLAYTLWTSAAQPNVMTVIAVGQVVLALVVSQLARSWLILVTEQAETGPAGKTP